MRLLSALGSLVRESHEFAHPAYPGEPAVASDLREQRVAIACVGGEAGIQDGQCLGTAQDSGQIDGGASWRGTGDITCEHRRAD